MPELPEVETIVNDISSALIGQVVKNAKFLNTAIREKCNQYSVKVLKGKELKSISRSGKNIIFIFTGDIAIVCHLKMTGKLIVDSEISLANKHRHFFIEFAKSRLDYYDVRKFGRICIIGTSNLANHPRLMKLGPEPFEISAKHFANIAKKRNKPIKLVLLDQEIVAGLGNIYTDESLFNAGIRPSVKASKISIIRLIRLHESIIRVLDFAISKRGTSVDDYLDGFGQKGNFQSLLKIYGKTGQTCPNCGLQFRRIVLGGRSTHYCPKCQK
ncbi:MAG: bifunctional DNA-formamidopyrimidine glycosylase/DNA-(apurinic or apyrimidinic site) lyase [candidate division Zixibacteria bacterium]|nr:bifunctional DNA-formamidopyrimidine glycosylase/DNA-(apurinic or apyrimidinic site) lyase [candidate division Zixibacteria bacterium]